VRGLSRICLQLVTLVCVIVAISEGFPLVLSASKQAIRVDRLDRQIKKLTSQIRFLAVTLKSVTKAQHDAHIQSSRILYVRSLRIVMSAGTCHHTPIPPSPTSLLSPDCPSPIPNATSRDPITQYPNVSHLNP
jgi:hypothetical protein